jgi:ribulose-phosphate 3-epimerase
MIKVSPSLLSADFADLGRAAAKCEECNADSIHCDVMDGSYVANITFGQRTIKALKNYTKLPLIAHLMIINPQNHIDEFIEAGADMIAVHVEECKDIKNVLAHIRQAGIRSSVVLCPDTPVESVLELIPFTDDILVMSVVPGYGGQKFIPSALDKIRTIRETANSLGVELDISVDGGINAETAKQCREAGANVFIAGNYVFGAEDMKQAIETLRCK